MKFRLALLITVLVPAPVLANYCAAPLSRTNETISGVVNTYYPVTTNYAGGSDIIVGTPRGASTPLRVGDLLLVIQPQIMQYTNTIGANKIYGDGSGRGWNALNLTGKFQWVRVIGTGGVTMPHGTQVLGAGMGGSIMVSQGAGVQGSNLVLQASGNGTVRSAQLVRVPQYGNATINGTVTALPYEETQTTGAGGPQSVGGIVALDVAGTLTFAGNINVDAMGFRGGAGHALSGSTIATTLTTLARFWAHSPVTRAFGGAKGEGGGGTPPRVYHQGTVKTGLDYSNGVNTFVSSDGYGVGSAPGGYGRGAPGNAGGGATDQCPVAVGTSSTDSGTMCNPTAPITYRGNRLNPGGGGGGGAGNGGDGSSHDLDGSFLGSLPSGYDQNTEQYSGGGLGGRGVFPYTAFEPASNPAVFGEHQYASLGGGGGAGSTNDNVNFANSSGGTGGGIVIIRAGSIAGTGSISANGGDAPDVLTDDGAGGGGGGGWILVSARQASSPSLTMTARGGAGGDASGGMGAGGGGGGGYIGTSTTLPAPSIGGVTGGAAGSISGVLVGSTSLTNAGRTVVQASPATAGSAGGTGQFAARGLSVPADNAAPGEQAASSSSVAPGPQCVPIATKAFSTDGGTTYLPSITTSMNTPFKMRLRIENPNENALGDPGNTLPQLFEQISFTDTYPAGVVNATPPNVQHTGCGSITPSATAGGNTLSLSADGSIQSESVCEITVDLISTVQGSRTNQIAAGNIQVKHALSLGDAALTLSNYDTIEATVMVPAGIEATKTSAVVSDPVNNTTNPKRIPGATVDYSIAISNPTGTALDNNTMILSDSLPLTTRFFVGNLTGGAPFEFTPGTSNLTCPFVSLADQSDCIDFSTDGVDWTYVPTPAGDNTDAAIRAVRFRTTGSMAGTSNFSVRYRVVVK